MAFGLYIPYAKILECKVCSMEVPDHAMMNHTSLHPSCARCKTGFISDFALSIHRMSPTCAKDNRGKTAATKDNGAKKLTEKLSRKKESTSTTKKKDRKSSPETTETIPSYTKSSSRTSSNRRYDDGDGNVGGSRDDTDSSMSEDEDDDENDDDDDVTDGAEEDEDEDEVEEDDDDDGDESVSTDEKVVVDRRGNVKFHDYKKLVTERVRRTENNELLNRLEDLISNDSSVFEGEERPPLPHKRTKAIIVNGAVKHIRNLEKKETELVMTKMEIDKKRTVLLEKMSEYFGSDQLRVIFKEIETACRRRRSAVRDIVEENANEKKSDAFGVDDADEKRDALDVLTTWQRAAVGSADDGEIDAPSSFASNQRKRSSSTLHRRVDRPREANAHADVGGNSDDVGGGAISRVRGDDLRESGDCHGRIESIDDEERRERMAPEGDEERIEKNARSGNERVEENVEREKELVKKKNLEWEKERERKNSDREKERDKKNSPRENERGEKRKAEWSAESAGIDRDDVDDAGGVGDIHPTTSHDEDVDVDDAYLEGLNDAELSDDDVSSHSIASFT